jgi:two-component system sensor histidine kinase KdpD
MALERTNFAAQAHEKALQAEAEELRSNLLSAVSHDLRTPLASIEGSASALLENRQLDGPAGELATNILQQSQRMNRQIRNLLDMTRVQGSIQLSLEWESLEDLVQNAIERTAPLLTKSVHMIAPDEPVMVKVDGALLEQVLVNLLENAARHAGNAPQVTVEFGKSENRAWATVSDNGPGVPPQNLKSIFEPFQRTGTAGFGLGLAICKAAVEAHGGEISALPTESGAKIRFEIPLEP